jgi:hypothetical protein
MRRKKRWLPLAGTLLLFFLTPGLSPAAELRFQSSTQYLWYTDPFKDDDQSDIVQYFKIGATGLDEAGRFSAFGYGRVSRQFGSDEDPALGDSDDVLGRLYFLYVDYALPEERGVIRLGRQFVAVGAGAGTIDGVRVDARRLGPLAVSAWGGYDVRYALTSDRTRDGNFLAGASVGGSFFRGNNVEISYLSKWDQGDQIREMLGARADQRLYGKVKGYVDWRFDLLHESTSEFLAGVNVYALPGLVTLTGEYFFSYPTFDADTIFTAFAVTRYREALGRVDWIVGPQLTLYGAYTRADYDGPTADIGTAGMRARPEKVAGLGVNASVDLRSGYPGDLTGFRVSADYALGKALLAAGITYDVFQRDSMSDDFSAKAYWVGGSCEFRPNVTARLRLEDRVTRQFDHEFQGRASLDLRF